MTTERISQAYPKNILSQAREKIELQFDFEGELLNVSCSLLLCQTASRAEPMRFKHNNFPFSCLYLFTHGGASVETSRGETRQLEAGKIYLLPAELPLYIDYTPVTQHYLHLHICDHSGTTLFDDKTGILQMDDPELFAFFVSAIRAGDAFALLLALHRFLHHVMKDRLSWLHKRTGRTRAFGELFTYLQQNPPAQVTIGELADLYHINTDTLSKRFKRSVGISLKDYLQQHTLTEAQSLLLSTSYTAAEIATHLGFSSSQYFQRFFRKRTCLTPRQFRQKHNNSGSSEG